jgi:hypothetical protein
MCFPKVKTNTLDSKQHTPTAVNPCTGNEWQPAGNFMPIVRWNITSRPDAEILNQTQIKKKTVNPADTCCLTSLLPQLIIPFSH